MYWTTKDKKKKIRIIDMTTDYIKNCIKLMDKKEGYYIGGGEPPDADVEFIYYHESNVYKEMLKELSLRGKNDT